MKKLIKSLSLLFTIILLFSSFTFKPVSLKISPDDYPRVDGSTATIPLAINLRSAVTGESVEDLQLTTIHSTTTDSFRALANNQSDLLLVYTPNNSVLQELKDKGVDIIMTPIGRDALVFFTNEKNKVSNLTTKQIQNIYAGNIINWKQVGGKNSTILPYQRDAESGSQVLMEKLVMGDVNMMTPKKDYLVTSMLGIVETVASYKNTNNALGYSVYYYIKAFLNDNYKIKLLKANGVMPSNKTIKNGTYPFCENFYAVIRADEPENSETRKLFNFITSDEGKKLIEDSGYVALN